MQKVSVYAAPNIGVIIFLHEIVFEQHMTRIYFYINLAQLPILNNNGVRYLYQWNYRYLF